MASSLTVVWLMLLHPAHHRTSKSAALLLLLRPHPHACELAAHKKVAAPVTDRPVPLPLPCIQRSRAYLNPLTHVLPSVLLPCAPSRQAGCQVRGCPTRPDDRQPGAAAHRPEEGVHGDRRPGRWGRVACRVCGKARVRCLCLSKTGAARTRGSPTWRCSSYRVGGGL